MYILGISEIQVYRSGYSYLISRRADFLPVLLIEMLIKIEEVPHCRLINFD